MNGEEAMSEELQNLRSENKELRKALRLLFEECVLSGNAYAKDHGWPKAIAAARSALAPKDGAAMDHSS